MPASQNTPQKLMGLVQAIEQGKTSPDQTGDQPVDAGQLASETIAKYNEYGKHFKSEMSMRELAEKLMQVAEFAEQSVMGEADDWFDGHTIKRNMGEMKKYVGEFAKVANEHDGLRQRMSALYDDMGRVLERYFEIHGDDAQQMDSGDELQDEGTGDTEGTTPLAYDTGEDEIEIGNSDKNPGVFASSSEMVPSNGQISQSGGFVPGGQGDDGEPHNMDDPEAIRDAERRRNAAAWLQKEEEEERYRSYTPAPERHSDATKYPEERDDSSMEMDEDELVNQLSGQGARDPKALAAWIGRKKSDNVDETAEDGDGLKRAKNLSERMVRLAREQLKGDHLIRFDTLPREIQIRAAWKLIR